MFNAVNEKIITLRRNYSENSQPCPYCKGYYSTSNLRNHVRLFCPMGNCKPVSNLQVMSRKMRLNIHEEALDVLRNEVFPRMNRDAIY